MLTRDSIPRPRPAARRAFAILGITLVFVIPALRWVATFWTDYLWFDSVDLTSVWTTMIFTRIGLVGVASVFAFAVLWLNMWLADRLSPRIGLIDPTPEEAIVERFQDWVSPRARLLRVGVSAIFGLLIGLAAGGWWKDYLLFRESVPFGVDDPQFGNDLGFYVFQLPFIRDVFGWAFQFIVVTALVVAALHYLNGGIRFQGRVQRVSPGVKVHLSVLVAVLALLKAVGYQLDKYDLLYSDRGAVFGASAADISARLPALNLLILISVAAAIMLLVNIRIRGWTLPAVALGLWLATSLLVGGLIPAAVQRFSVEPDEINKELPYVERNIAATREAFGLANVQVREFSEQTDADGNAIPLTAADITNNPETVDNLRLWDPAVLRVTYRQLQELRTFYKFEDVDVDRYVIGGQQTQVMLAARELDQDNIPGQGWVNQHLVFTHGFGTVLSPANSVTREGQPDFLVKDIPPQATDPIVAVDEARIYFGEGFRPDSFVFVGTKEREVDFPIGTGTEAVEYNTYAGKGGVELGSIFRRTAFALRFLDLNTLISGQLTSETRVLMVRNVTERVEEAAPFLHTDADPYLAVSKGRLVWIIDMYSTTNRYPYSTPAFTGRLDRLSGSLPNDFNYIRNSVKAVVDTADGTMDFYIVDDEDPLVKVYARVFPDLFTPGSEMPDDIRAHLRYPEDLFRVQTDMYNLYHVTDPRTFFNDSDPWQIAKDPSTAGNPDTPTLLEAQSDAVVVREDLRARFRDEEGEPYTPMVPYYLLMKIPGQDEVAYVLLQPFTPEAKPNMVSFMIANSGPNGYGELIDFQLPRDSFIDGPGQVGARIQQDPDIAPDFTLFNQEGSRLILGNMLVVPIEDSILYVQPVYLQSEENALPEFKKVVVVYQQNKPQMRDTLDQALAAVFGLDEGVVDPGDVPTELPTDVQQALQRAQQLFTEADAALRDGDLGTYQEKVEEAQALIDQALETLAALVPEAAEASN